MSTIETDQELESTPQEDFPLLKEGDRLTQQEFHKRYMQMPEVMKAELIEGVVTMPSPISVEYHTYPQGDLGWWIASYYLKTPHVRGGPNGSIILNENNELQPDLLMHIESAAGGNASLNEEGFLIGAPELVIEVSHTSSSIDMGPKMKAYQSNGVAEYLIWKVKEKEIQWLALKDGNYSQLPIERDLLKSEVFPGLWLNVSALFKQELEQVEATLRSGMESEAYLNFVKELNSNSQ